MASGGSPSAASVNGTSSSNDGKNSATTVGSSSGGGGGGAVAEIHFLNGKWVREEDCKVSALDLAVLRGFGVFDFLRTYERRPFLLDEHIDRLYNSAAAVGLQVPLAKAELKAVVEEGIRRSVHPELYIKLVLTGGVAADGISPTNPSLIGLFLKAGGWPAECTTRGIAVKSISFERFIPTAKSLNYMTAVVALQQAKAEGFSDVLYISHDGFVLEGTTVNFFAVHDGRLFTCDVGILYGCTRALLLRLARELGIDVVVDRVPRAMLTTCQETFICSTTREIHPVVRIDSTPIGDGSIGPVTRRLMAAFDSCKHALPPATTIASTSSTAS